MVSGKDHTRGRVTHKPFAGGISGDAMLRTPVGPKRAEAIGPGDLIVTRDNGLQPVRMVWSKRLTRADMQPESGRAPVRLKTRAIGPMMPARDVLVANDHRILVPGWRVEGIADDDACLIPAGELGECAGQIYTDRSVAGTYLYTFLFDSHQVFCASGLAVESFLPNAATIPALTQKLRRELVKRFPALQSDPEAYPPARFPEMSGAVSLANVPG